ncbi:EAL domain-containing protein [Paraclostridium bifermentans]|nr:EAL domain-containing protein [Paraclostridium bifermentans]
MVFDISIWIIKKVLEDYEKIKTYSFYENNKLYISVNVSFIEIEDEKFIEELIAISERTNFVRDLICLEVVESSNQKIYLKYKNYINFKRTWIFIAIDDFGVEYSNLDLLNEIDAKIIKLDKYFINDIKTTLLKEKLLSL